MDAIRVSSLNSFLDCSAKFGFQYIDKIQTPGRISLAFGTSIHAALKKNYAEKIFSRKDLTPDEVISEFSDSYDSEISNIEKFADDEPTSFVKDAGVELLTKYQKDIAPRIQPKIVEQKISVNFADMPYQLTCTLDLIDEDEILVDHKTTRKRFKMIPSGYKRQISGYKFLANKINLNIKSQRIDLLTAKSADTNTEIRHLQIETDETEFLKTFIVVSDAIKKGVFYPNRNSFLCNKKYCPFWNECEKKFGGTVK
jgi:hypothetical protein